MHYVIVRPTGADCSCGYEMSAMTGAQALGMGNRHAHLSIRNDEPARVCDTRLCDKACLEGKDKPEFADRQWHHPDCFNHTSACCPRHA